MRPLIAVDVGNSHIKLGFFPDAVGNGLPAPGLPVPESTLDLCTHDWGPEPVADWLGTCRADPPHTTSSEWTWCIGSVHRQAAGQFVKAIEQWDDCASVWQLTVEDVPLEVALARPDRVGIDRLLAAVAANRMREPSREVIIVDLGSAITVDVVTAEGQFVGGAILPGLAMGAQALHEQTDALPLVSPAVSDRLPPALGTDTESAIRAGLFWGTIGGVKELLSRLAADLPSSPQVLQCGGNAAPIARFLGPETQYVPHLVLGGIAIVAASRSV